MRFIRTYLLCAFTICIVCTWIISYNCSCETTNALSNGQVGAGIQNEQNHVSHSYLLVLIMTAPNATGTRNVIRETWLKLSAKGPDVIRHVFPIGVKNCDESVSFALKAENSEHGDIAIISDLEESYANLAKKSLRSFEYAFENFKFRYLLKVDEDSFVRLGAFLKALKDIEDPRLYWGFLDGRAKPIRRGKWKETSWILCDRYLPYQLGGGYVLSYDLVRFLALNSRMFKMYKNEDVSVGAWLAGLDIKYVHDPRFDTEWVSRGCNNQYLITHKKSQDEMKELFHNIVKTKFLCKKEFRHRYSYVYDWSALPSDCCKRVNGSSIP